MSEVRQLKEAKLAVCEMTVEALENALEEARAGRLIGALIIGETTGNEVMTIANFTDADRVIGYLERLKFRTLASITRGWMGD